MNVSLPKLSTDQDKLDDHAQTKPGCLYLVGTPIGNLGDLSPRAAAVLANVDIVAAEDTRRTLRLLNHLGLRKRLESYHEHNRSVKTPVLAGILQSGRTVALVSDAGMPCISDPGYELVSICSGLGITVSVIPGPSAAIVALAASGLVTDRFVFEGFLPARGKSRQARLAELSGESRTAVLYEAPHRLRRTLDDLAASGLGQRRLVLARELTKRHEEYIRLTVAAAIERYRECEPRGEYVLVIEGQTAFGRRITDADDEAQAEEQNGPAGRQVADLLRESRGNGMSMKDAVRSAAAESGLGRNQIYKMAVEIWREM